MKKKLTSIQNLKKILLCMTMPKSSRPRERLRDYGIKNLSDADLIAIILGRGVKGEPVLSIANKLLKEFGTLGNMLDASLQELENIKGIGFAKATQISAVLGIARRVHAEKVNAEKERVKSSAVYSPEDVANQIRLEMTDFFKEHFYVVSIDVRNKIIAIDNASKGTVSSSLVHPRETFRCAVKRIAAQIIVAHNHPSGDKQPSDDDIKITRRLVDAGRIMGIEVIDHLIITQTGYYSFKENGII